MSRRTSASSAAGRVAGPLAGAAGKRGVATTARAIASAAARPLRLLVAMSLYPSRADAPARPLRPF